MPSRLSSREAVSQLVIAFIVSTLIGLAVGHVLLVMLITAVGIIIYQYQQILKLSNWLWKTKAIAPPQGSGSWGRIFDGLDRLIRKHRKKQKQLNQKVRRFRDGAEALPDAGVVLGNDLTIQWSNKNAYRFLGIRWPGDSGQRIDNLLRAPEFSNYLEKGLFEQPCLLVSPVNSDIQLELRFMDYGQDNILLLARDISRVHRIEEMRRDFVANVSHELKTPLTVVRGYVEMIQATDNELDAHWLHAFSAMESQVSRMDRLVEQLLVLSRVEVNMDKDSKRQIDVPDMINHLLRDAQWLNEDKQHNITDTIDVHLGILGIDTEIKSALSNLIANAIAYTEAGGNIDIVWKRQGNQAIFSVKDNGLGIRPEEVNRLTERFYRVDKSRSRNTGGSGLGLAIVKHVLYHHHARLVIDSTWQKGSQFSIVFDKAAVIDLAKGQ